MAEEEIAGSLGGRVHGVEGRSLLCATPGLAALLLL